MRNEFEGRKMHVILAHGALGPYDELIMGSAAVIFLIIMGISWVRSRNTRPEFEDEALKEENQRVQSEKADEPDR
ncbi:MAG: hypothetical protein ABI700_06045, partial [Chloroflexota bacterium]